MSKITDKQKQIEAFTISDNVNLLDAMVRMNETEKGVLFVVDSQHKLLGAITAGDMRRWIVKSSGVLETSIEPVYNRKPNYVQLGYDRDEAKDLMLRKQLLVLPVLDADNVVKDFLFWDEVFGGPRERTKRLKDVDVIVMAGGSGTRMKPFTDVLPKPLLPLNEKPVLEVIMDNLYACGAERFQVVVNYKKRVISAYFESTELPYEVKFIDEGEYLGSCGGLCRLDRAALSESFILSNCDTLLNADFSDIYRSHVEHKNDATMICTARDFTIPYGVIELNESGQVDHITEKPAFHYLVNTGVYILSKSVLRHLVDDRPCGTPTLIHRVIADGGKVGVYPLPADARLDTGQWNEYRHSLEIADKGEHGFLRWR